LEVFISGNALGCLKADRVAGEFKFPVLNQFPVVLIHPFVAEVINKPANNHD
jgi:hypothetical protein